MTSTNQKRSKGNPGRFPGKLLGDQPAQAPETAFCKCACDLLSPFCALRLCFVGAAQLLVLLPCGVLRLFGLRGWLISPPQSTAHLLQKWLLGTDGPRPCALEDKGLKRREKALKASPWWTYWERLLLHHLHKSTEGNKPMLLYGCSLDFRKDCCDISLLRRGQDRLSLYSFPFSSSWNTSLQKTSAASDCSICCLEEVIHLQREQQTSSDFLLRNQLLTEHSP